MPDNYLVMFTPPDPTQAQRIIQKAQLTLQQGAQWMEEGKSFPSVENGRWDKVKSGPVNRAFYRFYVKAKKFYAKDTCISCGKCEHVCPLNNIKLEGGKPVWGTKCTHCMACIAKCPVEAIEYGKATKHKQRYLCPPYQGRENQQKGV